jgi:hypothetical protein
VQAGARVVQDKRVVAAAEMDVHNVFLVASQRELIIATAVIGDGFRRPSCRSRR